jgi:hypothetical protein
VRNKTRAWVWTVAFSAGVPLLGYGMLFCVSPWIYRGFKPKGTD